MSKAVRIHAYGGPEVLRWEDVPLPDPGPGEALIRHEAIGLNYIDVYFRTGLYKVPGFPAVIGQEGAGTVTAIGPDVTAVKIGDRVAYAGPLGAYAVNRVLPAERLIPVPDAIPLDIAASVTLQGLTAHYLLHRTIKAGPDTIILLHAAAGGVGLLVCQWARHLGATVIGVVSTPAKAELALQNGASHVVLGHQGMAAEVKRITGGRMASVVYDSVGKDTFQASIDCLAPLGLMVSYGNASGPVPPVDLAMLAAKGSLFITRPSLATYAATRPALLSMAGELFSALQTGVLHASLNSRVALQDAAEAHRALEARETTGSTVLIP